MIGVKLELVVNNNKQAKKQPEKVSIRVILEPNFLMRNPENIPPTIPPMPSSIMVSPRSFCPSDEVFANKPCTHVGSQEKIAQRPIKTAPKTNEPINNFLPFWAEKILSCTCFFWCFSFCQTEDSGNKSTISNANKIGIMPSQKDCRQLPKSTFKPPVNTIPIGNETAKIPKATGRVLAFQISEI